MALIWLVPTGEGFGFSSIISRYVDDRLTIVLLTNIGEDHTDVVEIAARIASIYLPEAVGANPIREWQIQFTRNEPGTPAGLPVARRRRRPKICRALDQGDVSA